VLSGDEGAEQPGGGSGDGSVPPSAGPEAREPAKLEPGREKEKGPVAKGESEPQGGRRGSRASGGQRLQALRLPPRDERQGTRGIFLRSALVPCAQGRGQEAEPPKP